MSHFASEVVVVAWCLQSVAYLVTCAFPTISTMEEVVVEREREREDKAAHFS